MSIEDDTIAETAIELRNTLALVASLPLFRELDPASLAQIADEIEWFSLPGGITLFEINDPADAVYFVIAGSLGVYGSDADGRETFLGRISVGECVGEMALISGKARSASVIALRDSEIGRWSKQAFDRLMLSHPQALLRIAQLTVQRLEALQHANARASRPAMQTFAVVPHDVETDAMSFASDLVAALNTIGRTELIWSVRAAEHTSNWFHHVERANDFVVYVTDHKPTAWTKLCMRQADSVLLIAPAENQATEWSVLEGAQNSRSYARRTELVLLHDGEIKPGAARRWLDVRDVPHHHVRARRQTDIERVARLITGHGIGLTLSGGGARGFAHVGVLRALEEAHIPIDAVGGTSIGSIVAGGIAAGWNYEELRYHIKRTFVETNPLNDYTFPLVSLVAGRKVSRLLRQEFGEVEIEDLPRRFFCVSANLTSGRSAVHRRGELWRWLRASVSIPGVLPPVFFNGEVFVDGATINNLPVDIMRGFGGGPVIGVDVGVERVFTSDLEEAEGPPLWRMIQWLSGKKRVINIFQILSRASMINSAANTAAVREYSDLLLQPSLIDVDLLNWQAFDRAVEAGYRYAVEHLASGRAALRLDRDTR